MELGDMDIFLFRGIINQYDGDILQFSRDGEPLLYPDIGLVGDYTQYYFTNIVTNGKLLWERRKEISSRFDTITISVIEDDHMQFNDVKKFIEWNKSYNPIVFIKFLGDYYNPEYEKLGLKTMRRILHNPKGDWDYQSNNELIPEIGICQDFMNKPSINWKGEMFICNRFDPEKKGKIGDLNKDSLKDVWLLNPVRQIWYQWHREGKRDKVPLCNNCHFWGVPRFM
jgi:radical SAM protein with 4Fe4S-binding SPASM domain